MGYHPRIETDMYVNLLTTRTRNAQLWFIRNKKLEEAILGYLAKFQNRYDVILYAAAIQGNHIHLEASFPKKNRAAFMRDLNASVARAVNKFCDQYPGGTLWGRRYSNEFLGVADDVENKFFYVVLQAVQDGLSSTIGGYEGYNCFHDAVHGISRKYKSINWYAFNEAKKRNCKVNIIDFEEIHELKFTRLPGYEDYAQNEYKKYMLENLERRRQTVVKARIDKGLGFANKTILKSVKPGDTPKRSKKSNIKSHRPRVISSCGKTFKEMNVWYFHLHFEYREASRKYRNGEKNVFFPSGMYPPPRVNVIQLF